jgi:excinuclease ABC subunit A
MMQSPYEAPSLIDGEIEYLEIIGAREHNLKNINLRIPRNKFVVLTGLSGSGKSSLAFDTIYAEGQRRYMESLSNYARQFVGSLERPDVEQITGLSPVISIEQKTTSKNPRSTVGTTTELYDFLRLLYARLGEAYSFNTGKKMVKFSEEQIIEHIVTHFLQKRITLLAPVVRGRKGHYRELFEDIRKKGYLKVRVDGVILDISPKMQLDRYKVHDIELVIDRLVVEDKDLTRIRTSVQQALLSGDGLMFILDHDKNDLQTFSKHLMCLDTGISYGRALSKFLFIQLALWRLQSLQRHRQLYAT